MENQIKEVYKKEIDKLATLLTEADIPYDVNILFNGYQIIYSNDNDGVICDAVCHDYSYGCDEGLLELMGLVDEEKVKDTVEGYLTAEEVFTRIYNHYKNERR